MDPLPWYRIAAPVIAVAGLAAFCAARPVPRFRAMLLGIGVMSGYAMLQDQVSAHLCPEYFSKLHPPIHGLTDPTLTGIAYGFLGSWWGGALLGYAAGVAATVGSRPPVGLRELFRTMLVLVGGIAAVTAVTGVNVALHADLLGVTFQPGLSALVPPERQRAALVVACYHFAAYVSAVVGSVVLLVWVTVERRRKTS